MKTSSWDTSNVTSMNALRNFNQDMGIGILSVTDMTEMFQMLLATKI